METGPRGEIKTPPSTMMKRLKGAGNDAVDFPLRSFTPGDLIDEGRGEHRGHRQYVH
jgi:hypothetical protein